MKCTVCKNSVPEMNGRLLTVDGDFACSDICEAQWNKDRDAFFNTICNNEKNTENWLLSNYPYYP